MKKLSFRDDVLPLKDKIFRLALRITLSRAEAEDIVQDVLIKVWNRRDDLAEVDSIEAYSLTVCRNLSLDRLQRKENDNVNLDDAPPTEADDAPPDLQMIRNERIDNIKRLIERLPIPWLCAATAREKLHSNLQKTANMRTPWISIAEYSPNNPTTALR